MNSARATPQPECLADSHAAWIVSNTDTPHRSDLEDLYPGLRDATDVFGHDTDAEDTGDCETAPIRIGWMDRVASRLLPSDKDNDFRW